MTATELDSLARAARQNDALAEAAALDIRNGFAQYNARFRTVTQRAKLRFETGDFASARMDAVERIDLYDICVRATTQRLETLLRERVRDHVLWQQIRRSFAELIAPLLDQELNKTFYNTLTRRFFRTRGVDAGIEFVALDIEPTDRITHPVARHSYAVWGHLPRICQRILGDYSFTVPYAHMGLCALRIAEALSERLADWGTDAGGANPVRAIELLETVFYRERRAYLVGRIFGVDRIAPLVIALVNEDAGLRRRRGADRTRARRAGVRLHAQLFPGRSGHGRRRDRVPAHAAAVQADRRALHRARPRQAGQDRALPAFLPSPRQRPR